MSININILGDRDHCRREEQQRRKLLRLAQVRQQSKQMAADVRRRYDDEQRRQVEFIDRIKAEELRAWKRKHGLHSPRQEAQGAATRIGEAHAAAAQETAEEEAARRRQSAQRRAAELRGRDALAKLEEDRKRNERPARKKVVVSVGPAAGRSGSRPATANVITHARKPAAALPPKNVSTQVGESILDVGGPVANADAVDLCFNTSSSSSMSVEDLVQPANAAKQPPSARSNLTSDTLSSSLELESRAKQLSKTLPLKMYKPEQKIPQPTQPQLPAENNENDATMANNRVVPQSPIHVAADLIRTRRSQQQSTMGVEWFAGPTSAQQPATQRIPLEPLSVASAWSAGLRSTDKPSTINRPAARPVAAETAATAAAATPSKTAARAMPLRQRNASPMKSQSVAAAKKPPSSVATVSKRIPPATNAAKQPFVPEFNKPPTQKVPAPVPTSFDDMPLPTQRNKPATTLNSTATLPPGPAARVQYYDHANRFAKEYTAAENVVQVNGPVAGAPNAMQAAVAEQRRDQQVAERNAEKRRISDLRGVKALEREKTRRDYDLMSAQLDELSQRPEFAQLLAKPSPDYTETQLQEMARNREAQANNLFLDMLSKPPTTAASSSANLVTCPRVDKSDGASTRSSSSSASSALNVAASSALLLDYVNGRSAELETSVRQSSEHLPAEKTDKLRSLLERINAQREQLLRELQPPARPEHPQKQQQSKTDPLAAIFQSVQSIEREKRRVLGVQTNVPAGSSDKRSQERAKDDHKTNEVRRIDAAKQQRTTTTSSRTQTDHPKPTKTVQPSRCSGDAAPVQIIIQVNGGTKFDKRIHTERVQVAEDIPKPPMATTTIPLQDKPKTLAYPKTPVKSSAPQRQAAAAPPPPATSQSSADGSSTSTVYQSLPPKLPTELSEALRTKPKLPPAKLGKQQTALGQYISRLLGMSPASIDQLAVSSLSSVETPGSSIIEVSSNCNGDDDEIIDEQRLDTVQRLIADNRSLIGELEQSLRAQSVSDSGEAQRLRVLEAQMLKLVEEGKRLKEALRAKELEVEQMRVEAAAAPIKSILKQPASPKRVQMQEVPAKKPAAHAHNAESCNARIAELTEKIEQIRREKQRLFDSPYTSLASTGSAERGQEDSTEYMPVDQDKNSAEVSKNSSKNSAVHSLEEEQPVGRSTQIGCSRDSGINIHSRPMTASDAHSPEPLSGSSAPQHSLTDEVITIESDHHHAVKLHRLSRPPITVARFAPQIDDLEMPHELSTIAEVDTPAATARSTTISSTATQQLQSTEEKLIELRRLFDLSTSTKEKLRIRSFVAAAPLEETNITLGSDQSSAVAAAAAVSVVSAAGHQSIPQIRPFPSHSRFVGADASGLLGSETLLNVDADETDQQNRENRGEVAANGVHIQPFPSHKDYALGVSGLCTSASIKAAAEWQDEEEARAEDAVADILAFPDVEAELRRRNLLMQPFEQYVSSGSSSEANGAQPAPSKPIAGRQPMPIPTQLSTSSSDNLEAEMQKIGLNWASSTIKKYRAQAQLGTDPLAGGSTSTSSDGHSAGRLRPSALRAANGGAAAQNNNDVSQPMATKNTSLNSSTRSPRQPLNLKDFLTRELLKRSNSVSTSSADESTMSSQFLRSLLGTSSAQSSGAAADVRRDERHRTSTPVRNAAADSVGATPAGQLAKGGGGSGESLLAKVPANGGGHNGHLFSGESGMSSVSGATSAEASSK